MSNSNYPPTLHNHILHLLEDQKQQREEIPDRKRFGVSAASLLLTHKKRRLTETKLPFEQGKEELSESVVGEDAEAKAMDVPDMAYYQKLKDECQRQEREQEQWARERLEKVHDLRKVYLFGLSKVSALQDLRTAPDAILPGNIVQPQKKKK
ncbi:hypothetical protein MPSEU_001102100 [Mayamaea pseudoterrestris]|nr:hypothetical protein MPSEU_001101900 [Mayamaea pseudoterrestris]GKZ01515.1 hypothetical protein MPSEU_001102100 [Mayamaea pseudoterrestris]